MALREAVWTKQWGLVRGTDKLINVRERCVDRIFALAGGARGWNIGQHAAANAQKDWVFEVTSPRGAFFRDLFLMTGTLDARGSSMFLTV